MLLADEPTGNLDEGTRDDIMGLLEGLWHEYGLTFIMVTHDSSIARRAPRLATIKKGQITLKEQSGGACAALPLPLLSSSPSSRSRTAYGGPRGRSPSQNAVDLGQLLGGERPFGDRARVLLGLGDRAETGDRDGTRAARPQPGEGALRERTAVAGEDVPEGVDPARATPGRRRCSR